MAPLGYKWRVSNRPVSREDFMVYLSRCIGSIAVLLLFSVANVSSAQLVGGAIQGTVRDSQGAVLPGASIVVRNVATGATYEQTTDASGHYQVLALSPGEYEVGISITGFRAIAHRGIRLTVGQTAVVDSSLELGTVSELIEVRADPRR